MPNLRRILALFALTLLLALPRGAIAEEADDAETLALTGGRLLTQTDSGEFEGTILIRDGRIEAVGEGVEIPEGAERIDVSGLLVAPGLIDARSVLWLPPESRGDGGNDGSLDILDGVDPYAEDWIDVARSGVTAVSVQPSNKGLFGGRGAVLRVGPGGTVEDLAIKPDAFVQAALGVNNASANSILRYRQFEQLKRALDSVQKYQEEWEKYEKAKKEYDEQQAKASKDGDPSEADDDTEETKEKENGDEDDESEEDGDGNEEGDDEEDEDDGDENDEEDEGKRDDAEVEAALSSISTPQDEDEKDEGEENKDSSKDDSGDEKDEEKTSSEPPKKPDRDETKEFLVGLLDGSVPLRIEVHREDDLRNALALTEEFEGLKLVVEGLSDPGSARGALVKRRTPMVLGPVVELDDTPGYRRDRDRDWPAGLLTDDSRWAIGTYGDQPADSALLRAHASAAVARGVPRDRVLRALTSGAAEVLGLEDELGSIAKGRRADLVAFAGDPIDPATRVALVITGGEVVYRDPDAAPAVEEVVTVVDADLPDRLPRRFEIRTRRLLGPDGSIGPGSVVVDEGRIEAAGESVGTDDGTPTYDVGDAVVSPGLFSAFGTFGQGRAVAESAGADAGFLRAVDAFDPTGRTVRNLARSGVLRIGFSPAPINVVAGAVGSVRLGSDDPVVDPVIGMALVLSASARDENRYPASLPGQVTLLREFLGLEGGEEPSARRSLDYYLTNPVIDRLDAVRRQRADRLRQGQCGAFFEVEQSAEVKSALELAGELGICPVLVGPGAIEEFPDRIAQVAGEPGLVLVLRPMSPGPEASRRMAAVVSAAGAGGRVLFSADDPEQLRLLAALAVASGLPRETALDALVGGFGPAVADTPEGPWQAGSPADLVVWDGSPLDLASRPMAVIVDGEFLP